MERILNIEELVNADLRFCLVNKDKHPYTIKGTLAQPDNVNDFVTIDELSKSDLSSYAGIGISIQASGICAIDVDHCFGAPFDLDTIDSRGKDILFRFCDFAYCEFSFSGTGLRILFRHDIIDNYTDTYYIKNSRNEVEYYQPSRSSRYVTLTGYAISINEINLCQDEVLFNFLNDYMLRPKAEGRILTDTDESKTIEMMYELVKYHIFTNSNFQDHWFAKAPGSGADESERDYYLINYLFDNITKSKDNIKILFEMSPYFKSKDRKHKNKWELNNNRYLNFVYGQIVKGIKQS